MRKHKPFWAKILPIRKMKLQDAADPRQFIGKWIWASRELDAEPELIEVQDVRGCAAQGLSKEAEDHLVKHFQINGTHFCHMYSFYVQCLEDRLPTKEEMGEFALASQIKAIKTTT